MSVSPDELLTAARALTSPLRAERDKAERTLLSARTDSVPALIEALTMAPPPGGTSAVSRAALLLGAMRARDAVGALFTLIEGKRLSADERPIVARALAEILDGRDAFDDRARGALELLAADDDKYTRAFAAQAFGALGDARSKGRIQALAQDKDPWVRERASAVLTQLRAAEAQVDVTAQDFAALVDQAVAEGGALKPWLDDLGDIRRAVREAAVAELVRNGKASVPFLIEKLNQPLTRARISAALALSRLNAPEAAGALLIAATAPVASAEERELRPIALRALANSLTGLEEGLASSLLPLARDADPFVRAGALLCLGRLADRAGVRAVVQAIAEDDPFVVESAAVALSEGVREDDAELVLPLLTALDKRPEPRAAVKEAILIALSRIAIDTEPLRVRVRHRVRREVALGATAAIRKAAIVLLERLFSDDDPPPLTVTDDVLGRLIDEHPEVRVVAASFLARHLEPGLTGAPAKLGAALARKERTVSLLALEALRRHDTHEALEVLEAASRDPEAPVASRAGALLEGFTPGSEPWVFVPRAVPTTDAPSLVETQRPQKTPSRVRAVTDDVPGAEAPVEARFTSTPADALPARPSSSSASSGAAPALPEPPPPRPPPPSSSVSGPPIPPPVAPDGGAVVEARFSDEPREPRHPHPSPPPGHGPEHPTGK